MYSRSFNFIALFLSLLALSGEGEISLIWIVVRIQANTYFYCHTIPENDMVAPDFVQGFLSIFRNVNFLS